MLWSRSTVVLEATNATFVSRVRPPLPATISVRSNSPDPKSRSHVASANHSAVASSDDGVLALTVEADRGPPHPKVFGQFTGRIVSRVTALDRLTEFDVTRVVQRTNAQRGLCAASERHHPGAVPDDRKEQAAV